MDTTNVTAPEMKQDGQEMYKSVYLENKLQHAESTLRILMERLQRTEATVGFLRDKLNHAAAHHAVMMQENVNLRRQLCMLGTNGNPPQCTVQNVRYVSPTSSAEKKACESTRQAASNLLSFSR